MADGSQQLLVILTAVCCENKKQVQFNIKEIDCYTKVYSTNFQISLWLLKYVKTTALLLIVLLKTQQQHHYTLAHQYPIPYPKHYLHLLSHLSLRTVRSVRYILFCNTQYFQLM
jgi:hypothetical protein